jgi:membrane protein
VKKMLRNPEEINNIGRLSWSKRFLLIIVHYLRVFWDDWSKLLLNILDPVKRKQLLSDIIQFVKLFYLKFQQEGILKEASALTYITLLGFIPFLTLIMVLAPKLPFLSNNVQLQQQIAHTLLPESAGDVAGVVSGLVAGFADKKVTLNLFSLILVLITSYSLFKVIRDTFDRILILEYQPHQDFISQIVKFFGTVFVGFFIILLLFGSSSLPLISTILNIPLFKQQLILILPFILQFVALIFLYMIMPSIKVKRGALFRTAFWTTLIWVSLKGLFDYYIYNLTSFEAVYGVLKSLPVFLFWIYVNWVVILGGMVLVAILEQKELAIESIEKKKHFVRMTLELYTDEKLDKDIEAIIHKRDLTEIIDKVLEGEKE